MSKEKTPGPEARLSSDDKSMSEAERRDWQREGDAALEKFGLKPVSAPQPDHVYNVAGEKVQRVPSTSDERVVNNPSGEDKFRHNYRVLSDDEKAQMGTIKTMGSVFDDYMTTIGKGRPDIGRELALAKTKMEEAVMWAVKGLTK